MRRSDSSACANDASMKLPRTTPVGRRSRGALIRLAVWARQKPRPNGAFTRLELAALLAALALVALLALPALAGTRIRSDRVLCANNLRQIAMALQQWGNDHGDRQPWEVRPPDGGTYQHALGANVWFHFAWMSNELATPKILFCPTDTGQPARDFTGDPTGGYLHPNFANRATSYFLSHSFNGQPNSMIAGDRNVTADTATSCSRFVSSFGTASRPYPYGLRWTSALHNNAGNMLALDGRVEQFTTSQLQRSVSNPADDNGSLHYITPR